MTPVPAALPGIAAVRADLRAGRTTCVALADAALARSSALRDLGALAVIDPALRENASARDAELARGVDRGPLHGVPYTVKASFAVAGLPNTAGSPAFADLRATTDAVVVERLRAAGALLVGTTTMPPMAIGGGQAGLYGRTRSPYSPHWLAAAWHSGSSIGSGVAVAAGLCAFGIGEETVSSGRSPASNNALVAYTPSWGIVPSAGNWPLHPYRDVVVPHTLDVSDLRDVLAVIAGPDERDVWQRQDAVDVSPAAGIAERLRHATPASGTAHGIRLGVPRLYLGEDDGDVAAIPLRPSIRALWDDAAARLAEAGVEIVAVDFPLVEAYEQRSASRPSLRDEGLLSDEWTRFELSDLLTTAWQEHLDAFGDGRRLRDVDPAQLRPTPPGALDDMAGDPHPGRDSFDFAAVLRADPLPAGHAAEIARPALRGFVEARERFFDAWMADRGVDAVVFPANSDIGRWESDVDLAAATASWADGTLFSSMNHVLRRVGLPSVTLPMGIMADTGMPVGLTVVAPAYDDERLLDVAQLVEAILPARVPPPLAPVPLHR
ncbi:amidase [Microbacterium sp. SORGH_AS 1204]|uniref:amidase family protein n=1 Tax=Microbacterium sp. SORGH_AS_1204 TaxID=3041785 RepID=UPI0027909653|nr:amidase family protein [Microbacterium sp. SORGH_AS_1204]MDQ1136251.1 amidase [Microbacterium sp. SORGH_AS_1204]